MPRMYAQGCWLAGAWKGKDGNTVFNKSGTADELRLLILTPVRKGVEFYFFCAICQAYSAARAFDIRSLIGNGTASTVKKWGKI